MDNNTNSHGFSRHIPNPIKLQIRQECGFGCVVCGMTIYTYEHIDPEFADAAEHDPTKMALLCGGCHLKVTKRIWSKDKIKKARLAPKCKQQGYSNDFFDIGEPFGISVGRIYFYKTETGDLLQIDGKTVLSMRKVDGEPPLLSGIFHDHNGNILFEIKDNEWFGKPEAWDIESVGNTLTIKDKQGSILLQINARPPHIVAIEIANLRYGDNALISNEATGQITIQTKIGKQIDAKTGNIITGGPVVIQNGKIQFHNGANVMLGQDGVVMNPLNFDSFILTGQIASRSTN
ncbi:MAG: HNH endonuclease [Deltaproteobacteria bacterium]|nr:HNH endonuclease [Deltaproteobacteria bacterium]